MKTDKISQTIVVAVFAAIVISGAVGIADMIGQYRAHKMEYAGNERPEYVENAANLATGQRNWVQVLGRDISPVPTECQTPNDAGFYIWEDGSISVAVPNGCVYDPDLNRWRQPIRWR